MAAAFENPPDTGASPEFGNLFGGHNHADYNILGSTLGSPKRSMRKLSFLSNGLGGLFHPLVMALPRGFCCSVRLHACFWGVRPGIYV